MSYAIINTSPAFVNSSQFISPCLLSNDTGSATEKLAFKGAGFVTSNEVAAVIRGDVATELVDAVMAALGSRFKQLAEMSAPSRNCILQHRVQR